jgi:hypothetical protein
LAGDGARFNGGVCSGKSPISGYHAWVSSNFTTYKYVPGELSGDNFIKHDNITLQIIPADNSTNGTAVNSSDLEISNSLPVASSPNITPTVAFNNNSLSGTYLFSDIDEFDVNTSFRNWYVNSTIVASNIDLFLSSNFSRGDTIVYEVIPYDGEENSTAVNSSSLLIGNFVPVASNVSIIPTSAFPDNTLTGFYTFNDADVDADGSTTRWYVNGVQVSANSSTLGAAAIDEDDVVIFSVEPYDGVDVGTTVNSSSLTINEMTTDRINYSGLISLMVVMAMLFGAVAFGTTDPRVKKALLLIFSLLGVAGALFLLLTIL